MKLQHLLILVSSFGYTCAVMADSTFDPGTLGQMKAVLEMCSRTSPQDASTYLLRIKTLIGDASRASVDKAMRTDAYQRAYQSIRSEFGTLSRDGVTHACAAYFASAN